MRYDDLETQFGAPWYFVHRVDLHSELKRLAQNPGDGFRGADLRLSCEVTNVECESGRITLKDGSSMQKDLIIAADGIHVSHTISRFSHQAS